MIQNKIYNYFERNEKLKVLFIFDPMDAIASELHAVSWRDGFRFIEFDGAWFKTKYALENEWKEDKVILIFKQASPFTSTISMLKFPLLDVLCTNMEYKSDDYAAFIQQHHIPQSCHDFIRKHIDELQLEKFNRILSPYYNTENFDKSLACRGLISGYLGENQLLDWDSIIIRMFLLSSPGEEKKKITFYRSIERNVDIYATLQNVLESYFGGSYNPNSEEKIKEIAESFKYNAITQTLAVDANDNYKRYKINSSLALDRINKLLEKAIHQSKVKRDLFFATFHALAAGIKVEEIIKTYGIDANYFYIPTELCWEILKKIFAKQLTETPKAACDKLRDLFLKQESNTAIQKTINYGIEVANYYSKATSLGSLKLNTPDEYVRKYISEVHLLDMFYRKSLENYHQLSDSTPIISAIEKVKKQLDIDYAQLCNILNLEWLTCLQEKGSSFNTISLTKQQDFYEQEKNNQTKQVIIISDALRYEVAAELMQYLSREKHIATLDAALAMLPTETRFCKPSLLPHRSIWLYKNDTEMDLAVDDKILNTLEKRSAHVALYREGAVCTDYVTVVNGTKDVNRELFKKPLVYIFHNTIDEIGHSNNPMEVVSACRRTIEQLAKLIRSLHASYNVTNVTLTSDHGFLYNDMAFEEKDKITVSEETMEKKSRYYITKSDTPIQGVIKFPLSEVSGMNDNVFVAVPEGTNRFAAQGGGYNFAHGGASLQELIIPVIHSKNKKNNVKQKVNVALITRNLSIVSSRLKFKIMQSEPVDMDTLERNIVCAVYANDTLVTTEKRLCLNSSDIDNYNNRIFDVELTLNQSTSTSIMQLRIFDVEDMLNPLIKETVTNNTLIEQDF